MMENDEIQIPANHPRAESLRIRETLIRYWKDHHIVAESGLIAHGRGEAFDYLIGETTIPSARKATMAAAAHLLLAKKPVISVNGNAAALASKELVKLARLSQASLEVNLFYRTRERIEAIGNLLHEAGASNVLGLGDDHDNSQAVIPELNSGRRITDRSGIYSADVVLVPLEDGDRTEALRRLGKVALTIDLNPLSRTAQTASVTIVDNVVRAIPNLILEVNRLKSESGQTEKLRHIVDEYDNTRTLADALDFIQHRLSVLSKLGSVAKEHTEQE
jgi:4-phosphopantoate---beta-alanine ligase